MTCRECWDPAPKGRDLCDWCAMTPEQRKRAGLRAWVLLIAAFGLIAAAVWLLERGA